MKNNALLRYVCLGGVFLLPLVPFVVASNMFFPFITGKNFLFRAIVEVVFAAWIVLAALDRSYAPRRSHILVAFSAFIVVVALADMFGAYPYKSFWSNFERMEGLVTHLHLFAYLLVAGSVLDTQKLWDRFWKTSLWASVVMGFYGIFQLAGWAVINQGGVRLDGRFGNAAYFAVYAMFHVFLAAYFLSREWGSTAKRWTYAGIAALNAFILYYTATRGTMLGLLAGGFVTTILIAVFGKEYGTLRKAAAGALGALVLLVGGFLAVRDTQFVRESPVLSRFASISLNEQTTKSRFMVWNMAWQGFQERPILGWGQENFNYVFNKYYDPGMYDQEQWFDRTHNIIFDWLIAAGALGLIAYISLHASMLWVLWRSRKLSLPEKSVLTGLLAGYFVHNFFVFDNLMSYVLFFSLAATLHSVKVHEEGRHEPARAGYVTRDVALYGIAPAMAIVLLVGAYYLNYRPMAANAALIDTMRLEVNPSKPNYDANLNAVLDKYEEVFGYGSFGSTEARERLLGLAPSFARAPEATKRRYAELATRQIDEQLKKTPDDARHLLFAGSFMSSMGAADQAISHLERALANSPSKQTVIMELASAHLNKGDNAKALEYLKKAYELEPANTDAKIGYAIGALYAKNEPLAQELLSTLSEETRFADNRLLNAYAALGRNADVLKIWQARVAKDPSNPQTRLSLVAAYLRAGDSAKAIAELETIKRENPNTAQQIDFYISEIRAGRNPAEG